MTSWFYMEKGKAAGPADKAELAALVAAGRISGSTSIRGADEQAWCRLDVRLPEIVAPSPTPSYLPIEPPRGSRWTDTLAHPWRRYFARMLDNLIVGPLMGIVLFVVLAVANPPSARDLATYLSEPGGRMMGVLLNLVLVIPANTLLIGLTGFTLGKWIFGVRILRPDGKPLGLFDAFVRELEVWFRGLGIGFPVVSLFTIWFSYRSLEEKKFAPWDVPTSRVVVHRPAGLAQTLMGLVGALLLVAAVFWTAALS